MSELPHPAAPGETHAPEPILDAASPDPAFPVPTLLRQVVERHRKPLVHIVAEMARLAMGPGKVDPEEYFALRLFDDDALKGVDKRSFAGLKTRRQIAIDANRITLWHACVDHKLTFQTLFKGYGLPVIETRAIYSPRVELPAINSLRDGAALASFLRSTRSYPLFGKPVSSSMSLGSVAIEGYEAADDMLALSGGRRVPVDALVGEIVQHFESGYLLQERLRPHAEALRLAGDRIATVRIYTINGASGPELFRACWKIPAGANAADNFWRKGNILAALDGEGRITRAVQGAGLDQTLRATHPDTGSPLVSAAIPQWPELVRTALWGAAVLNQVPLIGWDIAPADRGPVIVEANTAPDFSLVQMAENRGVLDDRLKAFLDHVKRDWDASEKEEQAAIKRFRDRKIRRVMDSVAEARKAANG